MMATGGSIEDSVSPPSNQRGVINQQPNTNVQYSDLKIPPKQPFNVDEQVIPAINGGPKGSGP